MLAVLIAGLAHSRTANLSHLANHYFCQTWRQYYNEDRPHSAIGYKVPIAIHNLGDATSPSS